MHGLIIALAAVGQAQLVVPNQSVPCSPRYVTATSQQPIQYPQTGYYTVPTQNTLTQHPQTGYYTVPAQTTQYPQTGYYTIPTETPVIQEVVGAEQPYYPQQNNYEAIQVTGQVMYSATTQASHFLNWLNSIRSSYGLGAVSYDANLENWAAENNNQQAAMGLGHHVRGPARVQNSGQGDYTGVINMWMISSGHRAALLDPTLRTVGLAVHGSWWTFNGS